jgi:hypothetical protein
MFHHTIHHTIPHHNSRAPFHPWMQLYMRLCELRNLRGALSEALGLGPAATTAALASSVQQLVQQAQSSAAPQANPTSQAPNRAAQPPLAEGQAQRADEAVTSELGTTTHSAGDRERAGSDAAAAVAALQHVQQLLGAHTPEQVCCRGLLLVGL